MSLSASSATPALAAPAPDTLAARAIGMLRAPRATLERAAATGRFGGMLLLTCLVSAGVTGLFFETPVGQLALLDQWERTAFAFGVPLGDAQYAAIVEASRQGALYAAAAALAGGPLLAVLLAALLLPLLPGPARASRYRQVLAVVAHAGVILAFRHVVATPINYARETMASPITPNLLFTMLDSGSLAARFFGMLDLFVVWWLAVLALGMSIVSGRPAMRLASIFVAAYVALALVLAGVMAAVGGNG